MDQERVQYFSQVVGSTYPEEVPPTFITICRDGEFELFDHFGISLTKVLHGEQDYSYFKPISVGMELNFQTTLSNAHEKRGRTSLMQFLTFETEITEQPSNTLVAKSKTTIIIREKI